MTASKLQERSSKKNKFQLKQGKYSNSKISNKKQVNIPIGKIFQSEIANRETIEEGEDKN